MALGLSLALLTKGALAGQESVPKGALEPHVPVHHWSRATLSRLAGAGLADPGEVLAAWPLSRDRVRRLLGQAVRESEGGTVEALARAALHRFEDEFPAPATGRRLRAAARLGAGWSGVDGALLGGRSVRENIDGESYLGPVSAPDQEGGAARFRTEAAWGGLAASIELRRLADGEVLDEIVLATRAGPLDLWVGRRGLAMGPSSDGGIVMSPGVALDGGGFRVPDGFRLPGFLRGLGTVRADVVLAQMDRSGPIEHPLFWGARMTLNPRPWITLGLNRAVLFGGDGNIEGVTPGNVLLMIGGITSYFGKDSGFENQVASLDFWMRRDVGGLPIVAYGEWGFEDLAFAWTNVPGLILGLELPGLPWTTAWSIGVEHVRFGESCCRNPPWYRHRDLAEGWTDRGVLLGHPLGGHGSEWALRLEAVELQGAVRVAGRVYRRNRGSENLFGPDWEGLSTGGRASIGARMAHALEIQAGLLLERGSTGWRTWTVDLGVDWRILK